MSPVAAVGKLSNPLTIIATLVSHKRARQRMARMLALTRSQMLTKEVCIQPAS